MKRLFLLFLMILLPLFVIISGYFVLEERTYILRSRATVQEVSTGNSLAVSTPSCVAGDGDEKTRLMIYCLNGRGLGEPNVSTSVRPNGNVQGLQIIPVRATTDETGRAIFDITSNSQGMVEVSIRCGDVLIKENHRLCFE